ncbi:MAG: molybdopterin-dependent oxidoreductase [Ilumatobacter sp.]
MSRVRRWPRRSVGLPNGQRLLDEMPRFSDAPTRWAPAVATEPKVSVRLGDRDVTYSVAELSAGDRFEPVELTADFHCVTTWSVRDLRWTGVRLRDVIERAHGTDDLATFARVTGADGAAARFLVDDLLADDVMLATHLGGEPLTLRHGAPLRLVSPAQYGYKNVKHVVSIEFVDREPESAFGAKEHLRGRVEHEERHSRLPNWAIRGPYRALIPLTAMLGERALRQRPAGAPVRNPDAR